MKHFIELITIQNLYKKDYLINKLKCILFRFEQY